MTWTLREVRTELRGQIRTAGLNAVSHWPQRLNPPVVIIDGGDPYLDIIQDKTFTQDGQEFKALATVRLEVTLVSGIGDNEVMRDNLDDLVCKVLSVLTSVDRAWTVERVSQPFLQGDLNGNYGLAVKVTVTTEFDLEEVN